MWTYLWRSGNVLLPRPPKAVIFDLYGTIMGEANEAVVQSFRDAFRKWTRGDYVPDRCEVLRDMGREKREHIRSLLRREHIRHRLGRASRWHSPNEYDVSSIYQLFYERQYQILQSDRTATELFPGVLSLIQYLQQQRIYFGFTTGFSEPITRVIRDKMPSLLRTAPWVSSDQVPHSRPRPDMIWRVLSSFPESVPAGEVWAIDDSPPGIQAMKRAGGIAVAVVETGAPLASYYPSLDVQRGDSDEGKATNREKVKEMFQRMGEDGPDFLVPHVKDLQPLIRYCQGQQGPVTPPI